ncbi:MAG: radical SAM protein, partial [Pseudomonadota bacterium]
MPIRQSVILIHPPVAKPCEAPAGIARLAGALNRHGIECAMLDAGLEGFLYLLRRPQTRTDTWTRRAVRNLSGNLAALVDPRTYGHFDRYKRAVRDVNRLIEVSVGGEHVSINLANYEDERLSPLRSAELIEAAERPEENPFYPYFAGRLATLVERRNPGMIGLSLNYLSQALCTFAMVGFLRQRFPALP